MTDLPKPRGLATLSPERRREISAMGGRAVKPENRSFSVSSDLAREAGAKGGISVPREKRSFFVDPDLARKAGAKGGKRRAKKLIQPAGAE